MGEAFNKQFGVMVRAESLSSAVAVKKGFEHNAGSALSVVDAFPRLKFKFETMCVCFSCVCTCLGIKECLWLGRCCNWTVGVGRSCDASIDQVRLFFFWCMWNVLEFFVIFMVYFFIEKTTTWLIVQVLRIKSDSGKVLLRPLL